MSNSEHLFHHIKPHLVKAKAENRDLSPKAKRRDNHGPIEHLPKPA